jgi:Cu+-exporting ATPase
MTGGLADADPRDGPEVASATCPGCGGRVDPLRAGHVAILDDQFKYFCGWACRERYLGGMGVTQDAAALQQERSTTPDAGASTRADPPGSSVDSGGVASGAPWTEYVEPLEEVDAEAIVPTRSRSDTGTLLLLSATVLGVLAVALALVGTSAWMLTARLLVAVAGAGLLVARSIVVAGDPSDPHPAAIHGPGLLAASVAVWARITGNDVADEAAVLTGLFVVSAGAAMQLVEQVRRPSQLAVAACQEALDVPARRVVPGGYSIVAASTLRPGEEILIDAGETVPADVLISAGDATVLRWSGARSATHKQPGDAMVAGARIISGRLRATVTWTGMDRAWLRSTADPARSAHVRSAIARNARLTVERWALASGALAGLAAFVNGLPTARVILATAAAHASIASFAIAAVPAALVLRGVVQSLGHGVCYRDAAAWDRAAHATAMVFVARGTLLLGEPQVAEIVGLGECTVEKLLSLAAGAETAASDAIALSVHRAARDRGVEADAVRSPTVIPGLGVTAVTSNGEALCVGSRALMLREHVSMARVESKLAELEALGRTVLMVAVGGKLVGFVGLQDGLRTGARAAVQHLLDARVEAVLLSGDARETCEAIARSLDIEHVRPEVLPADRAGEIRRLAESGATVAVVGRPGADDSALGAADVAVAMDAAGSTSGEWAVTLAGDDVRDAARAVVGARRTRRQAQTSFVIAVAPGIAASLAIAFGLVPAAYSPLAVLLGAIGASLYARGTDEAGPSGQGSSAQS